MVYGTHSIGSTSLGSTSETAPEGLGKPGEVSVIIDGERIETYTNIEINRRLNEVDTFSFQAFIENSRDRSLINEGNNVKIIEGRNNLLFKGRLTEVEYKSNFRAECEGDGMEVKLLDRKTGRETYNNNGNQIINSIIDYGESVSKGTIETAPQVNVRFDHDNKARAVAGVANATGYDWYIDQEVVDNFDKDYLNFVEDAGADTVQETFEIGENAMMVDRDKDRGFVANDITLLGRGDGINQLEANVFAATTKYTDTKNVWDGLAGFGIENINSEYNITPDEPDVEEILFNEDGSKAYILDLENKKINQYSLSTAYDLRTLSFSKSLDLGTRFNFPVSMRIKDKGTKLYVMDGDTDNQIIGEYDLSTAYEIDSASHNYTLDVSANASSPQDISLSTAGDILHVLDADFGSETIAQYNLSNNYELNSAVFDQEKSVDTNVESIDWSDDGQKLYIISNEDDSDQIAEYYVTTGFNIDSITLNNSTSLPTTLNDSFSGITWRKGGGEIFFVKSGNPDFGNEPVITSATAGNNILNVENVSNLGNTSEIIKARIGTEVVKAEILDNDELKILERGLEDYSNNSTEPIKHYSGVRVWLVENETTGEGRYTPENKSTAETGSSIDTFGVKEQRETDKTIVDISTLEKAADLELKNRFQDVFRMQIDATEPRITQDLQLGDTVAVKDVTAMDVDDNFEIVGFDIKRTSSEEGTILHLANRPRRLTERLSEIESDRDTLNAHMQGATNLAPINFRDNADNTNPLVADLWVPNDAVAVNKVDVKAKRQPFRGFVKANTTSGSSDTGEYLNATKIFGNPNSSFTNPSANASLPASPTGDETGGIITGQIYNRSGAQETYDYEIENTSTSTILETGSLTINDDTQKTVNYNASSSEVATGEFVEFRITNTSLDTKSGTAGHSQINIYVNSKSQHEHGLLGEQDFGIFQPSSEPDVDIDLVVDGNTVKTYNNVSVGDELGPIDVNSSLTEPIAGEYHEIKLVPKDIGGGNNGRCRLNTDVNGKIFIESTL